MPSISSANCGDVYTRAVQAHRTIDEFYEMNETFSCGRGVGFAIELQSMAAALYGSVLQQEPHAAFLVGRSW